MVAAPNAFPDSLFIKSVCAHAVFEKFTEILLKVRVICWNKVAWELATQKQEALSVNN